MDQRQQFLAGTEKLTNTTGRVTNAHRVALETEQIGKWRGLVAPN